MLDFKEGSTMDNYADIGRQLDAALGGVMNAEAWLEGLHSPNATAAAVALTNVTVDLHAAHDGSRHLEDAIATWLKRNADHVVPAVLELMHEEGDAIRAKLADAVRPRQVAKAAEEKAIAAAGPGAIAPARKPTARK
jgi:hypothetical protein